MPDLMELARAAATRAAAASLAGDLESRRARVIAQLRADPKLIYAFDVAAAAPGPGAAAPVSVVLGLRTPAGELITGELRVPAEKWPGTATFTEHWRQAAERRPS